MKYTDIDKGLKEGWLHELSNEKAKNYMHGEKQFVRIMRHLLDLGLIEIFWDDTTNDLVVCRTDKLFNTIW